MNLSPPSAPIPSQNGASPSASSSSLSWGVLVGVGAAAVAGAFLIHSALTSNKSDGSKPKSNSKAKSTKKKAKAVKLKGKGKKAATAKPAAAGADVDRTLAQLAATISASPTNPAPAIEQKRAPSPPPSEAMQDISRRITQSMQYLQETGDITAEHVNLCDELRQLDYTMVPGNLRLAASQWIVMFHTIKMMTSGDAGHALSDQTKNDMQLIWNVLSAKAFSSEEQERVADLLLCEAAQGLQDIDKVNSVFQRLVGRPDMRPEELQVAITVAPLLGRWSAVRQLSARLALSRNEAHMQFFQLPEIQLTCRFAEDREDIPLSQLKWGESELYDLQLRPRSIETKNNDDDEDDDGDADKTAIMQHWGGREAFKSQEWVKTEGKVSIDVSGAMGRMRNIAVTNLSTDEMPEHRLAGPIGERELYLVGFTLLNNETLVHEELKLSPSSEGGEWVGTYTHARQSGLRLVVDVKAKLRRRDAVEALD